MTTGIVNDAASWTTTGAPATSSARTASKRVYADDRAGRPPPRGADRAAAGDATRSSAASTRPATSSFVARTAGKPVSSSTPTRSVTAPSPTRPPFSPRADRSKPRTGHGREGPERLRPRPAARPSRRARPGHGLLLLQQRRHRRPSTSSARHGLRTDPHRRLGPPPRQRHPARVLRPERRSLLLDPPVPVLSRERLGRDRAPGAGEGYTVNVPLGPGKGDADYLCIFGRSWPRSPARSGRSSSSSRPASTSPPDDPSAGWR